VDRQQLIDRIYECSFAPEHWPEVLAELSTMADARGGGLLVTNQGIQNWTASSGLYEDVAAYVDEGWITRSPRNPRLFASRHAGFMTEHDLYTDAELALEPHYNDFSRRRGLGWSVRTALPMPTGDMIAIIIERNHVRGPVESIVVQQLDELRPHLARSALVSARLQLERARAAAETLALMGLPALLLDDRGKVIAANRLIEALGSQIHWRTQDRVSLTDSNADAMLRQAFATLDRSESAPARSFAVRATGTDATKVAHVIPIRGEARDIFVRCSCVVVITPVTLPQAPAVELVQALFDLTPAEARVARSLTAGGTLDEIAAAGDVSRNTVRTQLRGALEKTGCRRQSELVALLGGVTLRHAPPEE
jgi:DNA-binding CsgD family transcriptional regulator